MTIQKYKTQNGTRKYLVAFDKKNIRFCRFLRMHKHNKYRTTKGCDVIDKYTILYICIAEKYIL